MRIGLLIAVLAFGVLFDVFAQSPWRVSPPEWGFGRNPADKPVTKDVVVENRGTEPLRVAFTMTSECLYASPEEVAICPGGQAAFRLHFDPAAYEGPVEKDLIMRFRNGRARSENFAARPFRPASLPALPPSPRSSDPRSSRSSA